MHTEVMAVDRDHPAPDVIDRAAAVIKRGGLVVFPTETVYGLGQMDWMRTPCWASLLPRAAADRPHPAWAL